jgi:hypothetical protein
MLPADLMGQASEDLIQSQAGYLGDSGISIQRRQAVVSTIGRLAGNRYLQRVAIQMEDDAQAQGGKKPKKVKKKMIDKAKSVAILEKSFGGYKTMTGGTVKVLGQADFEKAWEKIYGDTKYAWATYVVPGSGNLEGFAYKGTNYINKDVGSVDVVPHEMLHSNADGGWKGFAGSNINEGTTEYLTIKAVKAAKYKPTHSYPNQEKVIRRLVRRVGADTLMKAYFNGETDALKQAVDDKCRGSWDDFKKAMDDSKWGKAKRRLRKKRKK